LYNFYSKFESFNNYSSNLLTVSYDRPSLSVGSNKPDRADRDEEEDYGNPPFTQRKRVCHIVLSDDEDLLADETLTQDIKAAVAGNGGKQTKSPSQPKISDYDPDERQVIRTAIEFYHSYLLTDNPFPKPREELDWVKDVFEASRIYNKLPDVELDSGIIKIVCIDPGCRAVC
jgi:hypothetical protein